jgi:outer membrane receptor protein involved in Fe transport
MQGPQEVFMRNFLSVLLLIVAVSAAPLLAQTESTTGSINGVVSDNTGVGLPGVTVTATNTETGLTRSVDTESEGLYSVPLLPPGRYRVTAELSGLGNATRDGITVLLGTSTKVDVSIRPTVAEEITVTAESPVVDVTQSASAEAVTQDEIENLPILGRDFKDLVSLTPGVANAFGGRVSLVGARGTAVDYNIDGANANSDFFAEERGGTSAPYVFSQAAIREFQVIRNTYSAEYSRGGGGTMNAITKSGTNDINGELFFFHRDEEWSDERNLTGIDEFFDPRNADQYGAAFGGPIMRDRLFYFLNGDFQKIEEPFNVLDFRTTTQFAALPADVRSAVVARLESLVGHSLDQEFTYGTHENQDTLLAKIDWNLANNNHFNLRWNYSDFNNYPSETTNNPTFSNQGDEFNTVNSYVGQLDTIFTSNLYNFGLLQYSLEERPINPLTTSFPQVNISGLASSAILFGQKDFLPNGTDEEKWEIKDTISYMLGEHQIRTGFNYLTVDVANLFPRDLAGDFFFTTPAQFLAGTPSRLEQGVGIAPVTAFDFQQWGLFVMDTWRPTPQWTLDLGVRYDMMAMPVPFRNIYETTNPEFDDDFNNDTDNIAPRLGFAYDIGGNGNSVIRGGIGMYYTPIPGILLAQPIQQTAGLFTNYSVTCSATVVCPTFPNLFTPEQLSNFGPSSLDIAIVDPDFESAESLRGSLGYQQQLGRDYSFEIANYKAATLGFRKVALGDSNLSWLAHYTWSEAIDQDTNSRSTSTSFHYDPYNAELSEGPSDNDVTHRVVASATYELPWGFLVSGIFNWRTGQPYTHNIFFTGGAGSLTGLARMGANTPVYVDESGDIIDLTQATNSTPAEFATFLNSRGARIVGRNTENQPDFTNLDMRLAKRFGIPWGVQLELIAEIFNVFNETNTFIGAVNQTEFTIRQTGSGANVRYEITRNASFGRATGLDFNSPPRQYQAAVKIHF